MKLKPEEIQVGDVLEAGDSLQYNWEVESIINQVVVLRGVKGTERKLWSRLNHIALTYNFIFSNKYSNLLPYHDRS